MDMAVSISVFMGDSENMGWERLFGKTKLVDGEKMGWKWPLVMAKVVEGERPFLVKLSGNILRRSQ